MDIQQLYLFIKKEAVAGKPEIESLKNMVSQYPYFQEAIFTYLKALYLNDEPDYQSELERLSISINDRRALFYHIFSEEYEQFFTETGRSEIKEDKTNILLNAFFESKGENSFSDNLEYELPILSLASTDYISYMESQPEKTVTDTEKEPSDEKTANLKHQDIIDSFINKSETDGGIRIKLEESELSDDRDLLNEDTGNDEELEEDVFFTETLAKIYVRQKKYEKAYKIIKHLSLNYPKKNIYFADQLSFLEKLIINSKYKDKK